MARKKQKKQAFKKPSRTALIAGIFTATITTTLLSFISLELAMLSFGLFALGAIVYAEGRRRQFWEQAASFKFKSLKDTQDALAKEVILNSSEIDTLKGDVIAAQTSMNDLQSNPTDMDDMPTKPGRATLPFELDTKPLPKSPRAMKPQLSEHNALDNMAEEDYESVSDVIVRELIHHAMEHKRVDVFIQPIMRLPQRQVRFYEMFARIRARPGQYLPASRYMEIAEQDNLDAEIDNLLLLHCLKTIQGSAHVKRAAPFFINIKNSTLKNVEFMKRLLGFVSKNRDLAPRLVFEIRQRDFDDMPPALLEIMRGLGKLGCSFSLDHVETLKIDIHDLQHFKIRFVKFAANKLNASNNSKVFAELHRSKRKLEANGIGVIVERIESEEQMRELLDYDVHYGQGYLFGKPELEGAYKKRSRARRMGLEEDVA